MPETYDAVIVGAGHNGLITACYLAKAGRKVLVLESRPIVGGPCTTEETWPGFRVSTAAYLVSLLQDRIVQELDLQRHGYQVDPKDPAFFSPFPDGRSLFLWSDPAKTHESIAQFSKRDAEAYPKYEAYLERLATVVEELLLMTPPGIDTDDRDAMRRYLSTASSYGQLCASEQEDLIDVLTDKSAATLLDEWFESDELKVTLATDGVIGANGGPHSPGTAYVLLHHCMGAVGGRRGLWGFVRGGMGAIPNAIASAARELGVTIRTSTPVNHIVIKDGRATGVVLQNGEEIQASLVASNADPHTTFLKLIEPQALPGDFLSAMKNYRSEGTSFKMNFALSGLPEFRALAGAPGPQHRATVHICPTMKYVEDAWLDAKAGRPSRAPLLELTIPTMYDPSLAPEGKHIMGCFVQYAPYTLAEGTWDDLRDSYAQHLIKLLTEHVPNLPSIMLNYEALSPLDIERRFGLTGGSIFHGDLRPDQLFFRRPAPGWARYRTPIRNLYMCGSGTHPGGGVMGAPGYNAACEILRDANAV